MPKRDIGTVAFKTLALWIVVSALLEILQVFVGWEHQRAQLEAELGNVAAMPAGTLLVWGVLALMVRAAGGVALWMLSDRLAAWAFPGQSQAPSPTARRPDLYAAASFLVGLWLLANTVPAIPYVLSWVRTIQEPGEQYALAEWILKLLLGLLLLRGDRVAKWALRRQDAAAGGGKSGAVQQGDSPDEAQD